MAYAMASNYFKARGTYLWDGEAGEIVRTNNLNHCFRHCRIKTVRIKADPLSVWVLH